MFSKKCVFGLVLILMNLRVRIEEGEFILGESRISLSGIQNTNIKKNRERERERLLRT